MLNASDAVIGAKVRFLGIPGNLEGTIETLSVTIDNLSVPISITSTIAVRLASGGIRLTCLNNLELIAANPARNTSMPKQPTVKPCTCSVFDVINFGCKCGGI